VFGALGLIPKQHHALVVEAAIRWNYTTWLNHLILSLAAVLLWRFFGTGEPAMLRMMNAPDGDHPHTHTNHRTHSA